jgi:PhnB protein
MPAPLEETTMTLIPYLFFEGRCEEALTFYREALGAEIVQLLRYREAPQPPPPDKVAPGSLDKIMHAHARIGAAEFMASDGSCAGQPRFQGFALALTLADAPAAQRAFAALAAQGRIDLPIGATFWSPCFGMVTDRFGMQWFVTVPASA